MVGCRDVFNLVRLVEGRGMSLGRWLVPATVGMAMIALARPLQVGGQIVAARNAEDAAKRDSLFGPYKRPEGCQVMTVKLRAVLPVACIQERYIWHHFGFDQLHEPNITWLRYENYALGFRCSPIQPPYRTCQINAIV